MGQRDDRHHHANRRRRSERQDGGRAPGRDTPEERVPLAGYEDLYEISRSGRLYSKKTRAAVDTAYHHSPVIRIVVRGRVVTLPKRKAVADSFALNRTAEPSPDRS